MHEEYLRESLKDQHLMRLGKKILSNDKPNKANIISEKMLRHKMTGWAVKKINLSKLFGIILTN